LCVQLVMCGAFYPNYFEQVSSDEVDADREIGGYNPCTTVMVGATHGCVYMYSSGCHTGHPWVINILWPLLLANKDGGLI